VRPNARIITGVFFKSILLVPDKAAGSGSGGKGRQLFTRLRSASQANSLGLLVTEAQSGRVPGLGELLLLKAEHGPTWMREAP